MWRADRAVVTASARAPRTSLQKKAGEAEHLPMRGCDAAQAVLMAKIEAALEVLLGGEHAPTDIVGIPEAAERRGLVLGGATRPSES